MHVQKGTIVLLLSSFLRLSLLEVLQLHFLQSPIGGGGKPNEGRKVSFINCFFGQGEKRFFEETLRLLDLCWASLHRQVLKAVTCLKKLCFNLSKWLGEGGKGVPFPRLLRFEAELLGFKAGEGGLRELCCEQTWERERERESSLRWTVQMRSDQRVAVEPHTRTLALHHTVALIHFAP